MGRLSIDRSFAIKYDRSSHEHDPDLSEHLSRQVTSPDDDREVQQTSFSETIVVEQHESVIEHVEYPIISRYVPDSDLPFITAEEVCKRSGNNGTKTCSYVPFAGAFTDRGEGIVVDDVVFDCSEFKMQHPGGKGIIEGFGGQDCSWQWWMFHSQQVLDKYGRSLRVARTSGAKNRHTKPVRRTAPLKIVGEQW